MKTRQIFLIQCMQKRFKQGKVPDRLRKKAKQKQKNHMVLNTQEDGIL